MEKVVPRRIVYLHEPLKDPQGNPGKDGRPYVVIKATQPVTPDSFIHVVGITGEFPNKPDLNFIKLKYGPNCRSRLSKASAALCTWHGVVQASNIRNYEGIIDPDELNRIVTRIHEMNAISTTSPASATDVSSPPPPSPSTSSDSDSS